MLMCLFVYFFDGLWSLEMISLPPLASSLILTCIFAVMCGVFGIPDHLKLPDTHNRGTHIRATPAFPLARAIRIKAPPPVD